MNMIYYLCESGVGTLLQELKVNICKQSDRQLSKGMYQQPFGCSYFRRSLNFCFFIQPVEKGFYRLSDSGNGLWEQVSGGFLPLSEYFRLVLDFLNAEVSLAVTAEQIDGKNLFIRKLGIGVIAESLAMVLQRGLIDITDIHI